MMRVLFVVLGVLGLFFALAAPAAAAGVEPPTDRPLATVRITESLRIAEEAWGAPAPCRVHVYAATVDELVAFVGYEVAAVTYPGPWPAGECSIWVSDELAGPSIENRVRVCTDLVHELGHAAFGYGHDHVENSVMNPRSDALVYGCYRRFLPRGMGSWWRDHFGTPVWAVRP